MGIAKKYSDELYLYTPDVCTDVCTLQLYTPHVLHCNMHGIVQGSVV